MIPAVSIILPTYNRRHTLDRAIRSLVAQTFSDWEIVVVDDGSSDQTEELCASYVKLLGSERFKYHCQNNKGASAARNHGLALARGRWVSFMDSDDVQMPEKLSHQIGRMTQFGCGFSFTGFFFFDDNFNIAAQPVRIPSEFDGNIYPGVLETRYNVVMTPSVVVDRELVLSVGGFDESMKVCEDIDLWGRVCRHTQATSIKLPHIGVHIRDSDKFPYMEGMHGRLQLYERAVRRDPLVLHISKASIVSMYEMYINTALSRGDKEVAQIMLEDFEAIKTGLDCFDVMTSTVNRLCNFKHL